MVRSIGKQQKRKKKRNQARAIARKFVSMHGSIKKKLGITENNPSKLRMKLFIIRAQPRRFGISFTIPDRIATEINDRKKISGLHPLRITRIPSGGTMEFHSIVEEAEKASPPLMNKQHLNLEKKPNRRTAYHRSHLNDWHPQVFHYISSNH